MKYQAQSDIWHLEQRMRMPSSSSQHSHVLANFKQVFPLTLLPDELVIEELRIIWLKRNGPWENKVVSIMATDIACVNASTGPFFGQIQILNLAGGPEIHIDKLKRSDVFNIRNLVEGIAMKSREGLEIHYHDLVSERESLSQAGGIKTNLLKSIS